MVFNTFSLPGLQRKCREIVLMAQMWGWVKKGAGNMMVMDGERVTVGWRECPGACSPGAVVGLELASVGEQTAAETFAGSHG